MVDYRQIRESLKFVDLTEDEKQKRGILARLWGPCASIIDATRNGRMYSDELWEKVFNENEIVREMFENGGIPMEMDHPVGREETDSTRIAAMLPEAPRRDKDGHLICYIDLIDTPCGKIAYQLAKYGFKLGISSRGSGDVLADDSVDPDTYDFTTFDLVLLPAVKDARLSMCESLDTNKIKLEKALKESYDDLANNRDKEIMKQKLEELGMDLNLENDNSIVEAKDDFEDQEEIDVYTVGDLESELKDYDKDLNIEFKPIVIDGKEYQVEMLGFDPSEEDKLIVSIGYSQETGDNIDVDTSTDEVEDADDEIVDDKLENTTEEVIDDESEEVIENLKEAIRQKDLLENEVKTLKSNKIVSDTEIKRLSEELDKYKSAFNRTSKIAAEAKKSGEDVKALTEQLKVEKQNLIKKDKEIASLKNSKSEQLDESINKEKAKIKILVEKLNSSQEEIEEKTNQLNEQANIYKKKLNESIQIAKKFKNQANAVLMEYIKFRASMLGVRPAEITNKLNESYTLADINSVCDSILTSNAPSVSFNLNKSSRVKITESKQNAVDDDGFDDLLELAGLKNI